MKIVVDNLNATSFPLEFACTKCGSVLQADMEDVFATNPLSIRPTLLVECPLCEARKVIEQREITISDFEKIVKRLTAARTHE